MNLTLPNPTLNIKSDTISILIVEDEEYEAGLFKRYLEEDLGRHYQLKIFIAISRSSARALLDEAQAAGTPFHAAVLDFKLPDRNREPPTYDLSFTHEVISRPEAVMMIAQYSAFIDDKLRKFWEECAINGIRGNLFDKQDTNSSTEIGAWIRQGLIEDEFTKPMQSAWFRAEVGAEARPHVRRQNGVCRFDLRYFASRLIKMWSFLDEKTQTLARTYFDLRFSSNDSRKLEAIFPRDFHLEGERGS